MPLIPASEPISLDGSIYWGDKERSFLDVVRHPHSKTTCEYCLLLKTIVRSKRNWLASEPPGSHAYGVCVIDLLSLLLTVAG